MVLNKSSQVRSQILLMTPLLSVNQAYTMVVSDENLKVASHSIGASFPGLGPGTIESHCILNLGIKERK